MKEVDIMLLANLKQKAIKWRKAAEAYEQLVAVSRIL